MSGLPVRKLPATNRGPRPKQLGLKRLLDRDRTFCRLVLSKRSPVAGRCCDSDWRQLLPHQAPAFNQAACAGEEHRQLYLPAYSAQHEQRKAHCSRGGCAHEPNGGHATPSSAQFGRRRCVTRVEKEVAARAEAVIDEVEGLVVTYSIIHDDVVLRHTSVESREYGDVGWGNDNDTPGERDAMDNA